MWYSMSNGDQTEAFEQLVMQEKQLRKAGTLQNSVDSLMGHDVSHQASLPGMMGERMPKWNEEQNALNERKMQLKGEGKLDGDVELTLRKEWEKKLKGILT